MVENKDNNEFEVETEEDFEYEYEYVEVPEGEELIESEDGYEYEYEYVEVPEDEATSEETSYASNDKEIPLEKELSFEALKDENQPEGPLDDDLFEEIDLDSFLKETSDEISEVNLDDIIVEEVGSEEVEEIDVDDILSDDTVSTTSIELEDLKNETPEENLNFEYVEDSQDNFSSEIKEIQAEVPETEIEAISLDNIEFEELKEPEVFVEDKESQREDMSTEVAVEEQNDLIDVSDLLEEKSSNEEPMVENEEIDVEVEELEAEYSDFKPIISSDLEEEKDFEEVVDVVSEVEATVEAETEAEEVLSEGQTLVSDDFAELLPIIPIRDISVEEENSNNDKLIETYQQIEGDHEFVLTPDIKFSSHLMSGIDYEKSSEYSKTVTKFDGISVFYSTRKQNAISISDLEIEEDELAHWNLVILDRKMVALSEKQDNVFPLLKDSVRLAKLIKNGQERVSFFNEEEYNVVPKTDSFGMIKGKFIVGDVEEDSGLLINDFINISLKDFYGSKIEFEVPVSGMLVGPKGSILYFSNLKAVILPKNKKLVEENILVENLIKSVEGIKSFYEITAQDEEKNIIGESDKNTIHINVGISTYGWNVVFDNDVSMSIKDLMTYQSRNGRMPAETGRISYGRKNFGFEQIKSISLYETPQYFSYGR